mmetsp:Transcript_16800/g.57376  ORF Transcript_16800/g.57376 Transcript_16800/m.57376 type:complete len:374 (-) Transcript_16800:68-1189(-)
MGRGGEDAEPAEPQEPQEDLQAKLDELRAQNEALTRENTLFEAYLTRVNPQLAQAQDEEEPKGKKGKGGKARRDGPAAKARSLTADEKNEIASAEIDVCTMDIESLKAEGEKELDELKAFLEETDLHIAETKKDTYEFKRDIVVGAENFRTGKTVAEKMLRYMEMSAGSKDAMIEKLRLKNVTLKSQITKLELQLQQKEEMGEVLHVIDFEQLKIENQSLNEKIEERNEELLKLRKKTTTTVQVLTHLKEKLQFVQKENEVLKAELEGLDAALVEKRDLLQRLKRDRDLLRTKNAKLKSQSGLVTSDHLLDDIDAQKEKRKGLLAGVEELHDKHMTLSRTLTKQRSKLQSSLRSTDSAGPMEPPSGPPAMAVA